MCNRQKKLAVINNVAGYGRCSMAVILPIVSAMKVQCSFVPTAIFSNHTGFSEFFFDDYTEKMPYYIKQWRKIGVQFDGICTGYLSSEKQISVVIDFLKEFKREDTKVIVDPVMGDHGKLYQAYSKETARKMKMLIPYADIITPNITEACILTDTDYKEKWSRRELQCLAESLSAMGPEKVVITGIIQGEFVANFCYEKGQDGKFFRTVKVGTQRHGTGDIFASVIAADAVKNVSFQESVKKAGRFIKKCIQKSLEYEIPEKDGVCFEEVLETLCRN